MDNIASTID